MYNTKNGVRVVSDKATREHLKKIKKRFVECLEQNISIEVPIQKLMHQDMHTILDFVFWTTSDSGRVALIWPCVHFSVK